MFSVFPNITVEMASDRRVYITVFGTERREVILPYFSDEIYCEMIKPTSVECKSMEYKVLLETGANNRVQRTVTVRKQNPFAKKGSVAEAHQMHF